MRSMSRFFFGAFTLATLTVLGATGCSSEEATDDEASGGAAASQGASVELGDEPKTLVLAEAGKPGDSVTFTIDKIDDEHKVELEVWGRRTKAEGLQRTDVKVEFEGVSTNITDSQGASVLLDLTQTTSTLKLTNMIKEAFDSVTKKSLGPASMKIILKRVRVATKGTDWCRMGAACEVPGIIEKCAPGKRLLPSECMAPGAALMVGDDIRSYSVSPGNGGKITTDKFGVCTAPRCEK